MTKINGYDVKSIYQGIMTYVVYKGGKEIGVTWSISDVARMCETTPDVVNEEMWKQG